MARGVEGARGAGLRTGKIWRRPSRTASPRPISRQPRPGCRSLASQVAEALRQVSTVGEKNLAATQEMTASIAEVAQAMESVAAVSEENSASVQEVSATAEELSAQVEEVAVAEELSSLAEQLKVAVGSFRLDEQNDDSLKSCPRRHLSLNARPQVLALGSRIGPYIKASRQK